MSTSQIVYNPLLDSALAQNSGSRLSQDLSRLDTLVGGVVTVEALNPSEFQDNAQLAAYGDTRVGPYLPSGLRSATLGAAVGTVASTATGADILCALGKLLDAYLPPTGSTSVSANSNNAGTRNQLLQEYREFLSTLQQLV